jgi:uncharacterized NAD(P)/FAD-binding protein YdhS
VESGRFDVAVIGAGASGALVAAHYRRQASVPGRLALIDAGARAARGLAYGTPYGAHLLNVPAGRMSAFQDEADHFLRWLRLRIPDAHARTFAPRKLYGDYLHDVLAEIDGIADVVRIGGTAVGLTRSDGNWTVHLSDGRTIEAPVVVLALGNLPPADPLRLGDDAPSGYLRDPWAPGATMGLSPDASILLIGTGLTMVDVALALRDEGHRGVIHATSRGGRVPAAHDLASSAGRNAGAPLGSPRALLQWMRREAGSDWRRLIDGMRPETVAIWKSWSIVQRRSFLRHLRSIWDVHRHRMAPEVAEQIEAMRGAGELQIHRGRVVRLEGRGDGVAATLSSGEMLEVQRVINCTGPATDYARLDHPLVSQMRRAGWLVPDPLGLGVEAADDGRLLDRSGSPIDGLFTLGPLRRPALWESTAIPEIRAQAAELARVIARGAG